jgi:hypothetical protein
MTAWSFDTSALEVWRVGFITAAALAFDGSITQAFTVSEYPPLI